MTKLNDKTKQASKENNHEDPNKTLVNCDQKNGEEITSEECEYLNQKSKAAAAQREKTPENSPGRDAGSKLCINCEIYPPFNKM